MSAETGASKAKVRPNLLRDTPPETAVAPGPCAERFGLPEAFSQLNDAVLFVNVEGRITSCNQAVARYGLDPTQLAGKPLSHLCLNQQSLIDGAIPRVLEEGRFQTELRGTAPTGAEWRADLCLIRLRGADSHPVGILAFCVDATDRAEGKGRARHDQISENVLPREALATRSIDGIDFIVASPIMHKFMGLVERVAGHTETVLIIGETGVGKELVARTIHNASHRAGKQLVDINCAALPEQLVESELFGYEKGAFSGADSSKPGLFELADKSTIFLDEIGELEPQIQVKLLRVLDGSPFYRLGGHKKIQVDVRVAAATNQNLELAVKEGRFRKDLYHRLSQFQLRVPPLRERPEDISALAEHFLSLKNGQKAFSADAFACLQSYDWPGNVRELRSLIAKLALTTPADEITSRDVQRELSGDIPLPASVDLPVDLDGMEEQMIIRALESTGGHRAQAADKLGISRRTLSRKLREYRINSPTSGKQQTLGTISHDQQKFFRAKVEIAVTLRNGTGEECSAKAQNLSTGGMGLEGVQEPDRFAGLLSASFALPESDEVIQCKVKLVWADAAGRAGARFLTIDPAQFQKLQHWTNRQMEREGWELPS